MNKQMRILLTQIEEKANEAKGFKESGDFAKAKAALDEADMLKKKYDVEKRLFEINESKVPSEPAGENKSAKTDGFKVIAKMLAKKSLSDTEKALITGTDATNGENNLVPDDVRYEIRELRKQYKSAKNLVTVIPTDTLSGGFNFESGAPAGLTEFDDGDEISSTGEPSFVRKSFAIKRFGKIIPISNILNGNEKAGLRAYLNRWFVKNAVISENAKIFGVLKTLGSGESPKSLKGLAALKTSLNKDLDPDALIGAVIVTNQTGFDLMDSETDAVGNPLLKESYADPTVKLLKGLPIEVFSDAQLPNVSGKAPVFYGSLEAACYFMERSALEFAVSEHANFTKNQTVLRVIEGFDVIQADKSSYCYGLYEAPAEKAVKTKVTNTASDPVNTKAASSS